ncbi:hypothetical protein BGAL_0058g00020 [Botrytis galanthina]|uniref:Uncharacterized protein n=1 Tax=Botrytis galanthina TaxID=278940 RepID=A0A4S8RF46_9HELO|nr:hypothetical protein BGAL_0058g00020 [Botrytis galanthina]
MTRNTLPSSTAIRIQLGFELTSEKMWKSEAAYKRQGALAGKQQENIRVRYEDEVEIVSGLRIAVKQSRWRHGADSLVDKVSCVEYHGSNMVGVS